jgi:hypothetical protein
MELLCRQQRESRTCGTQIEARLRAEDRRCADTGAIVAPVAALEHKAKKVVILPHARTYREWVIGGNKKSIALTHSTHSASLRARLIAQGRLLILSQAHSFALIFNSSLRAKTGKRNGADSRDVFREACSKEVTNSGRAGPPTCLGTVCSAAEPSGAPAPDRTQECACRKETGGPGRGLRHYVDANRVTQP